MTLWLRLRNGSLRSKPSRCDTRGCGHGGQNHAEPNAGNVIPGIGAGQPRYPPLPRRARKAAVEEMLQGQSNRGTPRTEARMAPKHERTRRTHGRAPYRLHGRMHSKPPGFPPKTMPSGAGHDAMVMAGRVPTAMLFLRSPGGISHHPDEAVLRRCGSRPPRGPQVLERLAAEPTDELCCQTARVSTTGATP